MQRRKMRRSPGRAEDQGADLPAVMRFPHTTCPLRPDRPVNAWKPRSVRTTDTGLACAEAEHRRLAHVLLSRGSRRERDAPCHRQREVPSHSRKRRQQRHGQRNPAGQRGYPAFLVDSVASNGCGGTGIKDISFPPGSSVSTTLKVTGKSPGSYAPGTRKNTVTVDASLQS